MTQIVKKENNDQAQHINQEFVNDNVESKVFITNDKDLIKEYYELRNRIFRDEMGLAHEKWSKTDHDDNSQIMVFTADGKVKGGLKIFISKNGELLSEEYEGTEYVYSNLIKRMNLDCDKNYAEFVDLIIDKDFRGGESIKNMTSSCIKYSKSQDCAYLFSVASNLYCRLYKKYGLLCGCKEMVIFNELPWLKTSEYNYSEDNPIMGIL